MHFGASYGELCCRSFSLPCDCVDQVGLVGLLQAPHEDLFFVRGQQVLLIVGVADGIYFSGVDGRENVLL